MEIKNTSQLTKPAVNPENRKTEEAAMQFEEIFTGMLVREMTKNLFNVSEGSGMFKGDQSHWKDFINNALSAELAKQEPLGFSEMVRNYIQNRNTES